MQRFTYQNFDIMFARKAEGEYSASVFGAGGEGDVTFMLADIQTALAENIPAEGDEDDAMRHLVFAPTINKDIFSATRRRPPTYAEVQKIGGALFKSVFKESLRISFETTRNRLPDRKTHLRIRLHLTKVPELAVLPWEYLYDADMGLFYAQARGTPIIRYLNIPREVEEPLVENSLRMLVVISAPSGTAALDVEGEWDKLQTALKPLSDQNLLTLEPLFKPTLKALRTKLQTGAFDIFHFIGHGVFDRQTGEGSLIFENEKGEAQPVSGNLLATNLAECGLKLAVINACEGAVSDKTNAYTGVAQSLCRRALIPAVLAMQFEITDSAAITFAESFYDALTKNYPIEAALAETRLAILNNMNNVEWATPVLYMRADDGRILKEKDENTSPIPTNGVQPGLPPQPVPDLSPELAAHYDSVFEALRDGQLVPFVGLDANIFGRASNPEKWERAEGLPDSSELARYLSRKFKYPLNDLPDLARIAQYSFATNQFGDLYDEISEIFTDNVNQPTPLHITLAEIAKKISDEAKNDDSTYLRTKDPLRRRFVVVSTGYDNLFETAFKQIVKNFHVISYVARGTQRGKFLHLQYSDTGANRQPEFINSPNDYNGLADGNPVILKLPGTVENVEPSFAITEDDYFDYLTNRELTSLLPSVITGKLKVSNHLFLGYSPCSWNMRALLYRIWEEQRRSYRESWAVLSETQTMDRTFWIACNVKVIHGELSKYIEGLRARAQMT